MDLEQIFEHGLLALLGIVGQRNIEQVHQRFDDHISLAAHLRLLHLRTLHLGQQYGQFVHTLLDVAFQAEMIMIAWISIF